MVLVVSLGAVGFPVLVGILVVSHDLVNPVPEVGHAGVHSGGTHVAVGGAPGDNSNKIPCTTLLTDQRTTRITLKHHTQTNYYILRTVFEGSTFQAFIQALHLVLLPGMKRLQRHQHKSWHL